MTLIIAMEAEEVKIALVSVFSVRRDKRCNTFHRMSVSIECYGAADVGTISSNSSLRLNTLRETSTRILSKPGQFLFMSRI